MSSQGATILGCAGLTLLPEDAAFFARVQPWGFILFGRNVDNPDQIRALTRDLRAAVGWDAPIFIDQEGGRVARLGAPHWREWLPALDQVAQNKRHAARAMYLRYRLIAAELRDLGDQRCVGGAHSCARCESLVHRNRSVELPQRGRAYRCGLVRHDIARRALVRLCG